MVSKLQMRQHIDDLTTAHDIAVGRVRKAKDAYAVRESDGAIEGFCRALRLAAAISGAYLLGKANARPAAMLRELRQIGPTQVTLGKPGANQVIRIQVA
jgi:hypothetical protein